MTPEHLSRRTFVKAAGSLAALALVPGIPVLAASDTEVIILHTNDTHSRIDPFPNDGRKWGGLGGVAQRATLIERVRETLKPHQHLLVLDSGDMVQGTPYYNFFGGEPEIKAMSAMGYAGATLGNHDFDNGLSGLNRMLEHANFPVLVANYDFKGAGSELEKRVKPYHVYELGGVRIGTFGLGIAFDGLVLPGSHGLVRYQDPLPIAREMVNHLKKQLGCSYVICLSHLGLGYDNGKVSDRVLAKSTPGLDLILGGHTHTFLEAPERVVHADGTETLINQVGWAGIWLGQVNVKFGPANRAKTLAMSPTPVVSKNLG